MNNPTDNLVVVRNLKVGYGDRVILQNINFEVRHGEVFGILGGSGSGKSTLLKNMIGLYTPLQGSVLIDRDDIVTAQGRVRMRILQKIGVTYQNGALFGSMTVLENVRLPLDVFTSLPEEGKDLVALSKLRLVGLEDTASKMPSELSGGMQKRAAVARAIVLDPCVLFLDEPSAGLDPITSAALDGLIKELARDFLITFVMVTHELPSIYSIVDRVILLDPSTQSIAAEGDPRWLRDHSTNPWVQHFFRREAE